MRRPQPFPEQDVTSFPTRKRLAKRRRVPIVKGAAPRLSSFCLLVLLAGAAAGQAPPFEWVRSGGGSRDDKARAVATDASGNVYVTGYFRGPALFGDEAFGDTGGIDQSFVSKLDAAGNFLWTRSSAGTITDGNFYWSHAIAVDPSGSILVAGVFKGSADFGTSAGVNAQGERDCFVVRYSNDGTALWARRLGGIIGGWTIESLRAGVASGDDGSIAVTGTFDATGNFGATNFVSAGEVDMFVAKLDPSGEVLWATKGGGVRHDFGDAVAVDQAGNILVLARFTGPGNFGGVVLPGHPLNGPAGSGVFYEPSVGLVKYDAFGNVLWARQESMGNEAARVEFGKSSVAIDSSDNVYISGWVVDRIPGSWSNSRMVIAKYDSLGTRLWGRRIGDGQSQDPQGDQFANSIMPDAVCNGWDTRAGPSRAIPS